MFYAVHYFVQRQALICVVTDQFQGSLASCCSKQYLRKLLFYMIFTGARVVGNLRI